MDGKRAPSGQPDGSGETAPASEEAAPEPEAGATRFGPLSVTRLCKEDGRALLVFARVDRGEP
jgi:hypothetical protein